MSTLKLGALLVRTLAKPVANSIKTQAKQHATFREFCISIAQFSHKLEMNMKMKFLGYRKEVIRPLNDTKAIEAGANFLSESFIFGVAATIILAENWRSRVSAKNRRNQVDDSLEKLEMETTGLRETIQSMQSGQAALQSKMDETTQENEQLKKMLDEILSVSLGLRKHTGYEQPTVIQLPGFEK
ncbi:hypothetical protein VKS41_002821 [Umbelopsis sp. WA50703]